ncbi:acyltransferase family protein [Coleofasciculus sp.]|uniref:acyltransferase family protein n=1 Tax=Coleofasciculus sp. TaxID=3100458 RepID=UPI0039F83817
MANISKQTQTPFATKQRVQWVDYAKGIGIFLVVFGHTLRGLVNSSILDASTIIISIDQWIYSFHMPLFFCLSGLFIERSSSKPLRDFVVSKLKVIAYPYFVWSVLQTVLQAIAGSYTNNPIPLTNLWRIVYQPVMQYWFLYSLFVIMLVYAIVHKLNVSPRVFLILAILFYLTQIVDVHLGSWGVLYSVRRYAIYLALGAVVGSSRLMSQLSQWKTKTLLIVTIGGFCAVGLAVGFNLMAVKLLTPIVAIFGIAASVALAILLDRFNRTGFVKQWGSLSLEIYVAHTIASAPLRIFLQYVLGFIEPIAHLILGTVIGIYAPIALYKICQGSRLRYIFRLA